MLRTLNAKPHVAKASTSCFYLECLYAGSIYSTRKTPLSTRVNTFAINHKAWVANLERIWGFRWVPSC